MNRRRRRRHRAAAPVSSEATIDWAQVQLTDEQLGLWCRTCGLPSGAEYAMDLYGCNLGTVQVCLDSQSLDHDIEAPLGVDP